MALYMIPSFAAPTTAAAVVIATGTAIKTHLQAKLGASFTGAAKIVEWGVSMNGDPTAITAADNAICELLTTGTVAATVTAHVAAGIQRLDDRDAAPTTNNPFTLSTSTTGYNSSAEGTITASRMRDIRHCSPGGWFAKQFPLGREPVFSAADYLRVRIHSPIDVGAYSYVVVEV